MKAQIWKIHVTEGVLGAVHGFFREIFEYYIPELGLAVNIETFFLSDSDRYASNADTEFSYPAPELVETIDISDEWAEALKTMKSGHLAFNSFKEQVLQQNSEE